jgi:hypothetical protein
MGGVAAELGPVDPRRAYRERLSEAELRSSPPRTKENPERPPRPSVSEIPDDDGPDPYQEALQVLPRGKRRGKATGKVRAYHRTGKRGDERCWMFTLTRNGYETLVTEKRLTHEGTTFPDGKPVVPKGRNPLDYPIHCGSCGTHSVECLQIEFLAD